MKNQFREAFDSIHATPQMKENTYALLCSRITTQRRKGRSPLVYLAACCALFAIVLCGIGGYSFLWAPVSYISVDINPSVELGLNRLDRVVTVTAYNNDGVEVLQNLDLRNKSYTDAIELLLANDNFIRYLTEDSLLSFTVVSDKESELLTGIQQCHGYVSAQAECHSATTQLVEDAHHSGLSVGKYQIFLDFLKYDSTMTPEEFNSLSIGQIHSLIGQYESSIHPSGGNGHGGGHHGSGGNGGGNGGHGKRHGCG